MLWAGLYAVRERLRRQVCHQTEYPRFSWRRLLNPGWQPFKVKVVKRHRSYIYLRGRGTNLTLSGQQ